MSNEVPTLPWYPNARERAKRGRRTPRDGLAHARRQPGADLGNGRPRRVVDILYSESPDAAHLFYASCVAHASRRAEEETSRGRDVVVDRYWLSTWAYNHVRGARLRLGELTRHLRAADFTFLLTATEEVRRSRLAARGASAEDERTLRPGVGLAIERRFRRGLRTRVAGTGVEIDLTGRGAGDAVDEIIASLRQARPRRP